MLDYRSEEKDQHPAVTSSNAEPPDPCVRDAYTSTRHRPAVNQSIKITSYLGDIDDR